MKKQIFYCNFFLKFFSPDPIPKQVPTTLEIERRASLEEMLTDVEKNSVKVLQPKIMTPGEIEEQKLEAQAKGKNRVFKKIGPVCYNYVLKKASAVVPIITPIKILLFP